MKKVVQVLIEAAHPGDREEGIEADVIENMVQYSVMNSEEELTEEKLTEERDEVVMEDLEEEAVGDDREVVVEGRD